MAQRLYLLQDALVQASGVGPVVELGDTIGREVQLLIDINRVQERESLDLDIWGSPDGAEWGSRPVLRIPRKYHCGTSICRLDLTDSPRVRYLRLEYRLNADRGNLRPFAKLSVTAEDAPVSMFAAAC